VFVSSDPSKASSKGKGHEHCKVVHISINCSGISNVNKVKQIWFSKTYPFHALLHCRYLYSKLTKRRPWDEVKGIDMGHQQLVGTVMAIVNVHTRCVFVLEMSSLT
jgi:hypothetical protein